MQMLADLAGPFIAGCAKLPSARQRQLKDREPLYARRPAGTVFVVKRGYVRLVTVQPDGKVWTRMVLGKGSLCGDLPFRPGPFLTDERALASGTACVLEIRRETLERLAAEDSVLQLLLLKALSAQLQFVDRRMQWQLISPLRNRIATALVDLICFAGGKCGHGHLVDVRLTHEEFAQFVVAARPVVSEVLLEFKTAGVIDYTRSHLCLLDLRGLERIAAAAAQ